MHIDDELVGFTREGIFKNHRHYVATLSQGVRTDRQFGAVVGGPGNPRLVIGIQSIRISISRIHVVVNALTCNHILVGQGWIEFGVPVYR